MRQVLPSSLCHFPSNDEITIIFNVELATEHDVTAEWVCQNDSIVFTYNLCRKFGV